jgi:hypothetical protein
MDNQWRGDHEEGAMARFRKQRATAASESDTIDLRVPQLSRKDLLEWGMPSRCPACGSYGYLDRIDLVDEVMHQHCPTCFEHWTISKHDIEVSAARSADG